MCNLSKLQEDSQRKTTKMIKGTESNFASKIKRIVVAYFRKEILTQMWAS
jgi:hypothetical protein